MAIETKTINYAKETDDVFVLFLNIVKKAKAGEPVAQVASEELQDLFTAVSGIGDAPSEFSVDLEASLQTAFSRSVSIALALAGRSIAEAKKPEAVEA